MKPALDQFRANLNQVQQLISLYSFLKQQTKDVVDLSDVLRAGFVFTVSALDYYVHELVRIGMLEVHEGKRPATKSFLRFTISVESARLAMNNPTDSRWLEDEIRSQHGWRSFQQPENITKAIRLISDAKFWGPAAVYMGENDAVSVARHLALIVDRRNKISHEADMAPTFPGDRWPIDQKLVEETLDFVSRFGEALDSIVS